MLIMNTKKLFRSSVLFAVITLSFIFSAFSPGGERDITSDEVMTHIKYLASDELEGRFPGTTGDSLAVEYTIGLFKSYGLIPVGEDGYRQRFSFVTEIKAGDENMFYLNLKDKEKEYDLGVDFYPLNFSSNGSAAGELVFAGYGINAADKKYDDFSKINLNGKIAVIMRYTPGYNNPHEDEFADNEPIRKKCNAVRDAGAKGIIIITGPANGDDEIFTKLRLARETESIGIPVIQVKREIIEKIFEANGKNLEEVQKDIDDSKSPNSFELGYAKVKLQSDLEYVNSNTANVIGFIEGTDPLLKDEVIVIGAHLDHLGDGMKYGSMNEKHEPEIHNGADDNASGSAGVIVLADKLASIKQNLKRSYIFMLFSGEEAGLLGSAYFTKSELFGKYNIVTMINMDMIGRLNEDKLSIEGAGTSSIWKTVIDSLNNLNDKLKLSFGESGFGPSDYSSFYAKNLPVLHFFTGLHSDYHKPSDDWQKINADGTAKVLNLVYDLVTVLDIRTEQPDFVKSKEEKQQSMRGFKVTLGIIPDYSDAVEGLQILGVKAGGVGENAGLQKGDIIKKMGSHIIKNIYDYTFALGDFKKGDETEIVVKRGEEEITLKVHFEK